VSVRRSVVRVDVGTMWDPVCSGSCLRLEERTGARTSVSQPQRSRALGQRHSLRPCDGAGDSASGQACVGVHREVREGCQEGE